LAVVFIVAMAAAQVDKPSPVPNRSRSAAKLNSAPTANAAVKPGTVETGEAVYFSRSMNGRKAASGDILDADLLSAAHASYRFGSVIRITNTANGRTIDARVVDRISAASGKLVSVSQAAAEQLEFVRAGSAEVKVELVSQPSER
jgi:rare lipoprotein A